MRALSRSRSVFIAAYSALKFVLITARVTSVTLARKQSLGPLALAPPRTCDGNGQDEDAAQRCQGRNQAPDGGHRRHVAVAHLRRARQ